MDPIALAREEFARVVARASAELGIREVPEVERARPGFGYFTARFHRHRPDPSALRMAAERASAEVERRLVGRVWADGLYLNGELDARSLAPLLFRAVEEMGSGYGRTEACRVGRFLVEHTSANPVHPLHIGHGRNAVLGDALARLLRFCGNEVEVHFLVNDCGVQVMYSAIGLSAARDYVEAEVRRGAKPDVVMGHVYSVVNAIAEIGRLKRALAEAGEDERRAQLQSEMDEWLGVLKRFMEEEPELVRRLLEALGQKDVASMAAELNRRYEAGEEEARRLVREAVELVLRGQRATLERLGVKVDSWDFESELAVWNGAAVGLVRRLAERWPSYVEVKGQAVVFRADKFVEELKLREVLDLPRFIPPATLTRSDGTTLYVTRDAAYALWQHGRGFDRVIRVISSEQTHEQAHTRIILYALGHHDAARDVVHYSYEMVSLPGMKMSARRGQYISLDEILDEAAERSSGAVKERGEAAGVVAERVGVGSVRYALLSASPRKPIEFRWEMALNMRQNSGPFLQYTYVRAHSILEKAGPFQPAQAPEMLPEERELVVKLAEWPSAVAEAVRSLRPDQVAEYLDSLALLFNSYYEKAPVIKAEEPVRSFRLALVKAVKTVMEAGLQILGIPILTRM